MQNYGERLASLDGELTELRQRIPKVTARIGVVEDEIEDVQHALQDLDCPEVVERDVHRTEQTRTWLRQEKVRLAQREDRMRQEKANLIMLQLRLVEAQLQVQSQVSNGMFFTISMFYQLAAHCRWLAYLYLRRSCAAEAPSDIECGHLEKTLEEELVDCKAFSQCCHCST